MENEKDNLIQKSAENQYLAAYHGELKFMLALSQEKKLDILYDEKTLEKIIGAMAFVRQIFVEQFNNEVHLRERFVIEHGVKHSQKALRNAKGKLTYTALKKTGTCIEMMSEILDALSDQYKQYLETQAEQKNALEEKNLTEEKE